MKTTRPYRRNTRMLITSHSQLEIHINGSSNDGVHQTTTNSDLHTQANSEITANHNEQESYLGCKDALKQHELQFLPDIGQ